MPTDGSDARSAPRSRREGGKPKAADSDSQPMGMAVLMLVPWALFTSLQVLFAFAYHHFSVAVWCLVSVWVLLALTFFVLNVRGRMGGSWFLFLSNLSLLAIFMACTTGLYNYWEHMFPYWSYVEGEAYTNVLASEPAQTHGDAVKIVFADSARVDTTRALGYQAGTVYCVAPIVDPYTPDRAEYWAVGTNCCPARADFSCGDTWDAKARSGIVVLGTSDPAVDSNKHVGMHWNLLPSAREYYVRAVREAVAAYDMQYAEHPIFVQWVRNPQLIEENYWRTGIGFLIASVSIYLLISIIMGGIMQMWSKRVAASQGARGVP